jgi:hypothetical protein
VCLAVRAHQTLNIVGALRRQGRFESSVGTAVTRSGAVAKHDVVLCVLVGATTQKLLSRDRSVSLETRGASLTVAALVAARRARVLAGDAIVACGGAAGGGEGSSDAVDAAVGTTNAHLAIGGGTSFAFETFGGVHGTVANDAFSLVPSTGAGRADPFIFAATSNSLASLHAWLAYAALGSGQRELPRCAS